MSNIIMLDFSVLFFVHYLVFKFQGFCTVLKISECSYFIILADCVDGFGELEYFVNGIKYINWIVSALEIFS